MTKMTREMKDCLEYGVLCGKLKAERCAGPSFICLMELLEALSKDRTRQISAKVGVVWSPVWSSKSPRPNRKIDQGDH